jgi:hypothetical protein
MHNQVTRFSHSGYFVLRVVLGVFVKLVVTNATIGCTATPCQLVYARLNVTESKGLDAGRNWLSDRFAHNIPCYGCLAGNLRPSSKHRPEHFPSFSRRSACRCIRNCCTSVISNGSGAPGRGPALRVIWWPGAGPNHRHADFQLD